MSTPAEELRAAVDKLRRPTQPRATDLQLAELLDHIADDMADARAVLREHPRVDGSKWRAVHPNAVSHDQEARHDWTAALGLARLITGRRP